MRGVADREQTRPPPRVSRSSETESSLTWSQSCSVSTASARSGAARATSARNGFDALAADFVRRALRNDIGALPIIAAVDLDDQSAGAERAAGLVDRRCLLRQPEPQHVDRRAEILLRKPGFVAQDRASAVGGDASGAPAPLRPSFSRTPATRPPSMTQIDRFAPPSAGGKSDSAAPPRRGNRGNPIAASSRRTGFRPEGGSCRRW